ncbi:MAG: right-handed parallel beta-helix repeat-containing protein, partial [bacterium]
AGNCTITGLTAGKTYTVKVEAVDSVIGTSQYTRDIKVGEPRQEWYADTFGSATSGYVIVDGEETRIKSYSSLYPVSANRVKDVTGGSGTIVMDLRGNENGKIADSEEGIMVYYTRLNAKTENFRLTATFELTNSDIMGNQAGFGIYALDIAGLGTKDAKYLNSVAVGNFKLRDGETTRYHHSGVRVVTGYETYDPSSTAGSGRNLDNTRVFSKKPAQDKLTPGEKFTYTLEKTNTGFLCTYEGETFEIPGLDKVMTQEDGSMIVALAVGRCNGTITDVTFEKNPGAAEGGSTVEQTEPKVSIYSAETSGTEEYTFTAGANTKGQITLYRDGEEIGSAPVAEDLVANIDTELWNPGGLNDMTYTFVPDASVPDLTSYDPIEGELSVRWRVHGTDQQILYTAPGAPVNGQGSREDPADLQTLLNAAMPGQTIIMLDGEYAPSEQYLIPRNVSGEAGKEILLKAEHTGSVKVTGTNMTSPSLLHIVGSYWHVYGIEFCDGKNKGVSVSGNNNTVEMCTMHDVGNSGLQISRYSGEPNVQEMWPSNNLIKNCEAYNCCDPARNDADGFAAKLTCGEGNVFYGCISHHNIDDGWDLYAKSTTGPIGAVTIENCVAYSNGFLLGDDPSDPGVAFGEGNGFKLGGENMYGAHRLINSVSFNNYAKGITSNSGPDCQVIRCTAYNNSLKGGSYNLSLYTKQSNDKAWVVDGVISVATNGTTAAELGNSNGVQYSLRSSTNYLFDGKKSENNKGEEATEDWFE